MIYTSPLKALSAQKRRQLSDIFGAEAVGLATRWTVRSGSEAVGSLGIKGYMVGEDFGGHSVSYMERWELVSGVLWTPWIYFIMANLKCSGA